MGRRVERVTLARPLRSVRPPDATPTGPCDQPDARPGTHHHAERDRTAVLA